MAGAAARQRSAVVLGRGIPLTLAPMNSTHASTERFLPGFRRAYLLRPRRVNALRSGRRWGNITGGTTATRTKFVPERSFRTSANTPDERDHRCVSVCLS